MLLFGNNLNKFTYNNFITEIIYNNHTRGTTMVTCNYHEINLYVYFFCLINIYKIFVFMPIGKGKNKFQYKRACIVLSFYHKLNLYLYYSGSHELCIILTKGIVIFRN